MESWPQRRRNNGKSGGANITITPSLDRTSELSSTCNHSVGLLSRLVEKGHRHTYTRTLATTKDQTAREAKIYTAIDDADDADDEVSETAANGKPINTVLGRTRKLGPPAPVNHTYKVNGRWFSANHPKQQQRSTEGAATIKIKGKTSGAGKE